MYIYDRRLTASRGLSDGYGALHGLQGDKRPEVVSPATQSAEVHLLKEEMTRLAQRNAWSGVERTYESLETISKSMGDEAFDLLPTAGKIHFLAAEAALMLGKTLLSQTRFLRGARSLENRVGMAKDPTFKDIVDSLEAMEKTYGAVTIAPQTEPTSKKERKRLQGRGPALTPVVWPIGPDQRKSIEVAALMIKDTGSFTGLLPAGNYTLADQSYTVDPGTEYRSKTPTKFRWGK